MIIMLKTSNYTITLLFKLQNVSNFLKVMFFKLNKVLVII